MTHGLLASHTCSVVCQPAVTVAPLEADSEVTSQIIILKGLVRTMSELLRSRLILIPPDASAASLPHPISHEAALRAEGVDAHDIDLTADLWDEARYMRPSHAPGTRFATGVRHRLKVMSHCVSWVVLLGLLLMESLTP